MSDPRPTAAQLRALRLMAEHGNRGEPGAPDALTIEAVRQSLLRSGWSANGATVGQAQADIRKALSWPAAVPLREGDGDAREAAGGPWREGFERVTLPTGPLFHMLEALSFASMYLNPPEDWKPHKFDPPEQYAGELVRLHRELIELMRAAFDEIEAASSARVQDTPAPSSPTAGIETGIEKPAPAGGEGQDTPARDPRSIASDAIDAFIEAIRTHEPSEFFPGQVTVENLTYRRSGVASLMKRRAINSLAASSLPVQDGERRAEHRVLDKDGAQPDGGYPAIPSDLEWWTTHRVKGAPYRLQRRTVTEWVDVPAQREGGTDGD